MNLYFVKAENVFGCCFAGHWLAESPKAAIEIGKTEMDGNTLIEAKSIAGLCWKATKSKAKPEDMALNYPKGK